MMDKTLLILDDDAPLRGRLRRAMEVRGFDVIDAGTVREGVAMVRKTPPAFAILDMKLDDGTGLTLVQELRKKRAEYAPSAPGQHSLAPAVVVAFHHLIALMLR